MVYVCVGQKLVFIYFTAAVIFGTYAWWTFNAIVLAYLLSVVAELTTKLTLLEAGT